ncbi:hypothetical protein Tco_0411761 [Tanacetum coccineum]
MVGVSVVVCGDGVDIGLEVLIVDCLDFVVGVVCRVVFGGVVKAPISAMIVRVPEKDRWCGTRGKFVRWKGVRVTKASKRAKMGVRVKDGLKERERTTILIVRIMAFNAILVEMVHGHGETKLMPLVQINALEGFVSNLHHDRPLKSFEFTVRNEFFIMQNTNVYEVLTCAYRFVLLNG